MKLLVEIDTDTQAVVPKVPTPEMIEAAASFGGKGGYSKQRGDESAQSYEDMLSAAPAPAPVHPQSESDLTLMREAGKKAAPTTPTAPAQDAQGWESIRDVVMMAGAILDQPPGTADNRHPYWPEAVKQAERALAALTALRASSPADTREPLSEAQIEEAFQEAAGADEETHIRFARAIEALVARGTSREKVPSNLHTFLDAAAGEGLVLGGVDAADLYVELFPKTYVGIVTKEST